MEQKDAAIRSEIEASKSLGAKCDKWDEASKILGFLSDVIGFISPTGAIVKAGATIAGSGLKPGTAQDLVSLSASVTAVAARVGKWATAIYSGITEISEKYVAEDFSQYCVKFEGPFKARMHGEVARLSPEMNEQNWWRFETIVSGTLSLRYPKPNQSDDGNGGADTGFVSKIMDSQPENRKPRTQDRRCNLVANLKEMQQTSRSGRTPCLCLLRSSIGWG